MIELILVGASGLAREVLSMRQHAFQVVGIVDDDPGLRGTDVDGIPVLGGLAHATEYDASLLVTVGSGASRRAIVERLHALGVRDGRFATVVDESVHVPPSCRVGAGTVLLAQVAVTHNVRIGRHVVVMPNVTLTHDDRLGDYSTLAAGVALGGGVSTGEAAYLGMNASVRQGVVIGSNAVVGMGAAVLQAVPDGEVWAGVPARAILDRRTA